MDAGSPSLSPEKIWEEYERGVSYNTDLGLYDTVRQNENFFIGKQWEGVLAPDLDKPTFNILKRVVSYFISTIASDDVSAQVSAFGDETPSTEALLRAVSSEFDRVIENNRLKAKNRDCIRDAAVDGDACLYIWYDPDRAQGSFSTGEIVAEVIENTNVYFGNPQVEDIQRQPSILIARRVMLEEARKEALSFGGDPESSWNTGKSQLCSASGNRMVLYGSAKYAKMLFCVPLLSWATNCIPWLGGAGTGSKIATMDKAALPDSSQTKSLLTSFTPCAWNMSKKWLSLKSLTTALCSPEAGATAPVRLSP